MEEGGEEGVEGEGVGEGLGGAGVGEAAEGGGEGVGIVWGDEPAGAVGGGDEFGGAGVGAADEGGAAGPGFGEDAAEGFETRGEDEEVEGAVEDGEFAVGAFGFEGDAVLEVVFADEGLAGGAGGAGADEAEVPVAEVVAGEVEGAQEGEVVFLGGEVGDAADDEAGVGGRPAGLKRAVSTPLRRM